jgi:hypothetical protein
MVAALASAGYEGVRRGEPLALPEDVVIWSARVRDEGGGRLGLSLTRPRTAAKTFPARPEVIRLNHL